MTARLPLVLRDGKTEQLQVGDDLDIVAPAAVSGGRLSLSATPVTSTDFVGTSVLYWAPLKDNRLKLLYGGIWRVFTPGTFGMVGTPSLATDKNYDIFATPFSLIASSTDTSADTVTFGAAHGVRRGAYATVVETGGGLTSGTKYYVVPDSATSFSFHPTLADAIGSTNKVNLTANITSIIYGVTLNQSAAWASDTSRADAVSGEPSSDVVTLTADRSWLNLGTIRATGSSVMTDSVLKRFVWNRYNRRWREFYKPITTDSWTYNSTTVHQANAPTDTTNKVEAVIGAVEDPVIITLFSDLLGAPAFAPLVGIGQNTTTAYTRFRLPGPQDANYVYPQTTPYNGFPQLGYNYWAALESIIGAGTMTQFGDNGGDRLCGIMGGIRG